jgi:hypothetical protein
MKPVGSVSLEMRKEMSNIRHGIAEAGLGALAMLSDIGVSHIAERPYGIDTSLLVGGLVLVADGVGRALGASHALQRLDSERSRTNNSDRSES